MFFIIDNIYFIHIVLLFFLLKVEESLSQQKSVGFTDKDVDDIRRLISDTSIYLLGITMLASMLHLLFEFLAFQSDISFWSENKSLAGLSTRTVVSDLFSQIIIFLFLIESDTSILVTIPTFFGICIQAWKVKKATGFQVVKKRNSLFGYVIEFSRWNTNTTTTTTTTNNNNEGKDKDGEENNDENTTSTATATSATSIEKIDTKSKSSTINTGATTAATDTKKSISAKNTATKTDKSTPSPLTATAPAAAVIISEAELTQVTLEADRFATSYIGFLLLPVVLVMCLRSLVVDKHASWYSWTIGSLTGCVYTFGFALMCPQLFINHKLKSVAALPWKFLVFKFLNTFIDGM